MSQLREEDSGWYWCRAASGHTEHTSSVKLHIHKELCSSQDPETTTPVKSTSSSLAASSTPTQRGIKGRVYTGGTVTKSTTVGTVTKSTMMGTVTKSTTGGTVTKSTMMGTVTKSTTVGTVTKSTTMGTGTKSTTAGTDTKSTTVGTVTKSTTVGTVTRTTRTLLPTATPGTSGTSPGESYHESSSGESHLLPAVLPALALLICITVTVLALVKIKLQKKTGGGRSTTGSLEAATAQAGPSPAKEQTVEETSSPGKVQECKMDSGKCSYLTGGKCFSR
ncbi:mucin-5AC-like isoform X2 [Pseudopipra pipra]|uniref:mucin-5AC-like isoform X2 n=1 Tax=Pseudopipra pipra TaxID=415032 RepID=UPI00313A264A